MTPETWQLLSAGIASLGFPIFVAVYLLVFVRKTIQDNTEALRDLTTYLKARDHSNPGPNSP